MEAQLMNNPKPVDSILSNYSIIKYYSIINPDYVLAYQRADFENKHDMVEQFSKSLLSKSLRTKLASDQLHSLTYAQYQLFSGQNWFLRSIVELDISDAGQVISKSLLSQIGPQILFLTISLEQLRLL